jgi:hypothetical protein
MTKVIVATGNSTGLPDQTGIEVFAAADGGYGGYSAIVDPANPTRALAPDASGNMPVTVAALPLPTGASTAAKQPALGTAGAPSADVISVQGETGMTDMAVPIEASGGATVDFAPAWTVAGVPTVFAEGIQNPTDEQLSQIAQQMYYQHHRMSQP